MVPLTDVEIKVGGKVVGVAPSGTFDEAAFRLTVVSLQWPKALDFLQQKVQVFAVTSTNRKFRESLKLDSVTGDYKQHSGIATFVQEH
jgi:hypothetical protein